MESIRDDIFQALGDHEMSLPGMARRGIQRLVSPAKPKPKKRKKKVRKGGVVLKKSNEKGIWVDAKGRKYKRPGTTTQNVMVRDDGVWFEYDKKTDKWYPTGS